MARPHTDQWTFTNLLLHQLPNINSEIRNSCSRHKRIKLTGEARSVCNNLRLLKTLWRRWRWAARKDGWRTNQGAEVMIPAASIEVRIDGADGLLVRRNVTDAAPQRRQELHSNHVLVEKKSWQISFWCNLVTATFINKGNPRSLMHLRATSSTWILFSTSEQRWDSNRYQKVFKRSPI